jgi:hypothetical protein
MVGPFTKDGLAPVAAIHHVMDRALAVTTR